MSASSHRWQSAGIERAQARWARANEQALARGLSRESEPKRGSSVSRIRRGIVCHLTLCRARRRVTGRGVIEKLCKVELISTEIILHFIPTVF